MSIVNSDVTTSPTQTFSTFHGYEVQSKNTYDHYIRELVETPSETHIEPIISFRSEKKTKCIEKCGIEVNIL